MTAPITERPVLLAIESSCDDTAAAVLVGDVVQSNKVAGQEVHNKYGGVVPELASRAHQANIVPVVDLALKEAGVSLEDLNGIVFTQGPGLLGSLLVGSSFAKSISHSLNVPLIGVNHMQAHILAHFIRKTDEQQMPVFPFLCLTVSGGHTQIVLVQDHLDMKIVGETIDDAAGEAFDKAAKVLGLPYPGGPLVDRFAQIGDPVKYKFTIPRIAGLDFSFSGLKTSLLYFLRDKVAGDPEFIDKELNNVCASYQSTIVRYLLGRLEAAARQYNVSDLCLAGGVSANSLLRKEFAQLCQNNGWRAFVPPFEYCTDNAAMIGIAGYYKYLRGDFAALDVAPTARIAWGKV